MNDIHVTMSDSGPTLNLLQYICVFLTGKCSHGGILDITVDITGTGGINKDLLDAELSPHHYLHTQVSNITIISSISAFFYR